MGNYAYRTLKPSSNSNAPYAKIFVYPGAQSISGNYTKVSWELKLYRPYSVSSSQRKNYSVRLNGTTVDSGTYAISGSGTKTIASGTATISHRSDGTKTLSFGATVEFGITFAGQALGTKTVNDSFNLKTIPRVSKLTLSPTSIYADGADTVTATGTKASSSFTDTITVSMEGESSFGVTSGRAFSIPESWCRSIRTGYKMATVKLTTKKGSDVIGSASKSLKVMVPAYVKPAVSGIAISEADPEVAAAFPGIYVKGLSRLKVKVTADLSGTYGTTLSSYETAVGAAVRPSGDFTTGPLQTSGTLSIKAKVKDSRGRWSDEAVQQIEAADYFAPTVTKLSYEHIDAGSGQDTVVTVSGKAAPVNGQNTASLKVLYKKSTEQTYSELPISITGMTFTDATGTIAGTDPAATYEFKAVLTDKIRSSEPYVATSGAPVFSLLAGGKGARFFGEAEAEGLWVGDVDHLITADQHQAFTGMTEGPRTLMDMFDMFRPVPVTVMPNDDIVPSGTVAPTCIYVPGLQMCFFNGVIPRRDTPDWAAGDAVLLWTIPAGYLAYGTNAMAVETSSPATVGAHAKDDGIYVVPRGGALTKGWLVSVTGFWFVK